MHSVWKSLVAFLTLLALTAATGCTGSDEGDPAAAIPAPGEEDASTGNDSAHPASDTPRRDALHPIVVIKTSLGAITMELNREKSPLTTDNFLFYVESGHYDRTIFHQVIKDTPQVILGGALTAKLVEKSSRTPIRNEAHNGLKNARGTIAMARRADAIDSATCHFFVNVTDNTEMLDHKARTLEGYGYCVFGKVTDGMDVVDKIAQCEVEDTDKFERIPVQTVMIESIRHVR